MAVTYKKKKFMYQYAKEELKLPVPSIRQCVYRFHGGWEWLSFNSDDYECFVLTFAYGSNYRRLQGWYYDDDGNKVNERDEVIQGI